MTRQLVYTMLVLKHTAVAAAAAAVAAAE